MALTKRQELLIKAIHSGSLLKLRSLLAQGYNPDVKGEADTTPLHQAVDSGFPSMVKALVKAGAGINKQDALGRTPLDLAYENDDAGEDAAQDIIRYLRREGAKTSDQLNYVRSRRMKAPGGRRRPASRRAEKAAGGERAEEPRFTAEKLKDIFNPQGWVGKTEEMEKLWGEVPKGLRAKFDFAAALSEAKRHTMHHQFPPKNSLRK